MRSEAVEGPVGRGGDLLLIVRRFTWLGGFRADATLAWRNTTQRNVLLLPLLLPLTLSLAMALAMIGVYVLLVTRLPKNPRGDGLAERAFTAND